MSSNGDAYKQRKLLFQAPTTPDDLVGAFQKRDEWLSRAEICGRVMRRLRTAPERLQKVLVSPTMKKLFQGEIMKCAKCKRSQRSDPNVESNWTAIEMDRKVIYLCPACFGNIPDYWSVPYWARHK
jgi:hypothetical protein